MIAHEKGLVAEVKRVKRLLNRRSFILTSATLVTATVLVMIFMVTYLGRIYPGVMVGGMPMGGLTFAGASDMLKSKALQVPASLNLVYGREQWPISSEQIGARINIEETVDEAITVGRRGNLAERVKQIIEAASGNLTVPLVIDWQENVFEKEISQLGTGIEVPAENPEVIIENGSAVVTRGHDGLILGRELLKANVERTLARMTTVRTVEVPTQTVKAEISESEAADLKAEADRLKDSSLVINFPQETGIETATLGESEIVAFLNPRVIGEVDEAKIASYVATLRDVVNRLPENAEFQFVGGSTRVTVFKPAVDGLALDDVKTIEEITGSVLGMLNGGEKKQAITLSVSRMAPSIKTESVNDLGIKELLGQGTSYFAGSIAGRVHNIELGTSRLNGVLVAPGETFSFNKTIGEISAETGYQQAYVIEAGKTVLGDGGGVCQISTTLFRAVLEAGLPVIERWAHAYRVHYYEESSQIGLDATVYAPSVDFKFQNDTENYILIQARVDGVTQKLTFGLYGTSDGRVATLSQTRIWDVTPPPPTLYQDDPTLPAGQTKQIDFSAWGTKTAFDWMVVRGTEVLQKRTFYSNYQPWRAVYLKGTKTG